jgi:Protein of unknown function (DUF3306)
MAGGDGFLSRWARRKAGATSGASVPETPLAPLPAAAASDTPQPSLPTSPETPAPSPSASSTPAAEPAPLPTLDDVARLTHASDFSPYVARNVDAGVRNAAMKKLFSDPHFNVMDGLDTYIDDYGKADPIPLSMLRRMNQSAVLGLFDEEAETAALQTPPSTLPAEACPDGAGPDAVAESLSPVPPPAAPESRADDDPDLQLQPDDADRRPGAGPGSRH